MSPSAPPHRRREPRSAPDSSQSWTRILPLLGVAVLVAGLGYLVLGRRGEPEPTDRIASSTDTSTDPQGQAGAMRGGSGAGLGRGWEERRGREAPRDVIGRLPDREPASNDPSVDRVEKLLQVRSADGSLTEQRADEIRRTLRELARRGDEGSAAIDDLRRRLENGELDADGAAGEHDPASFGGDSQAEAPPEVQALLERLAGTLDPMQIAMLAQELDEAAPGEYRQEVLNAARQALDHAARQPPEERVDTSPVFEVFEAYGGEDVAKDLQQDTAWWPYSLMALAGMPDGQGIPALIATASDERVPIEQRPQLVFQILAQAAAEYPEAGAALVDLARAGQIPDRAWGPLASALEGMHLQFPSQIFADADPAVAGAAPRVGGFENESHDIRYDLRLVSPTWSEKQVDRQLDLIDQLIEATGSATAKESLNDARSSLLGGE